MTLTQEELIKAGFVIEDWNAAMAWFATRDARIIAEARAGVWEEMAKNCGCGMLGRCPYVTNAAAERAKLSEGK